jgi:surfeit locus 1 family protein
VDRRWFPFFPTLLVVLSVGTMIALGIWQLARKDEKGALLATYRANLNAPPLAEFPIARPVPASAMFRTASVSCAPAGTPNIRGGKDRAGQTIFRVIMPCRLPGVAPGSANPLFHVDMGGTYDPQAKAVLLFDAPINGIVTTMPPEGSFIARMFRTAPPPDALLIAETAGPNMVPSAPPNVEDVPNDHLAYAIQWFLFAGFATLIYVLALRKRIKGG